MRLIITFTSIVSSLLLTGCAHKGTNPIDPYEPFNRKMHNFNMAVDATMLKPVAKLYKRVTPSLVRKGVSNFFNNIDMLPTIANDVLQAEGKWAIKDSWRFFINSTLGIGGVLDVADKFSLPPHYNDLGLTLAKWGDKNSPYLVIPLLGPSTFRDGAGMLFQFVIWTPYVYINDALAYSLVALHYVDLRSQLLETEPLMNEAFDKYSFIRDAYLQHRQYLIAGSAADTDSLYIDDDAEAANNSEKQPSTAPGNDYVDE